MGSSVGPGSVIANRYRLDAQLGQGGMGSVWRAEHLTLRSPVAVKLIDPEIAGRPETLERFQAEAQAAASLRSPHVVQILDYGVDAHVPYIVMEMLEGESLADRLARIGRLPHTEVARVVLDVARALTRAHEAGIVHRDLKPENVFLVRNDDQDVAKVLDFGIAKTAKPGLPSAKGPTRTGSILGTPGYMSPEQAQGTKAIDHRSDLWALGVIVFECVVGRVPFDSEALGDLLLKICVHPLPVPSQLAPVPPGFDAWFARACCREVDERFQTAKELAEALRLVLAPELDRGSASISLSVLAAAGVNRGLSSAATVEAPATSSSKGAVAANTVPGISLATSSGSKRSAGAYVAAALGLVMLGSGVTWLALTGRLGRHAGTAPPAVTAAMITTAVPSVAAPTSPTPIAPTVEVAGAPATPPPPSVTPATSAPDPTPTAKASAAAKATKPPHGTPPPPPPHRGGGGDTRLGF
jgi:serine/threonine-protein kinase